MDPSAVVSQTCRPVLIKSRIKQRQGHSESDVRENKADTQGNDKLWILAHPCCHLCKIPVINPCKMSKCYRLQCLIKTQVDCLCRCTDQQSVSCRLLPVICSCFWFITLNLFSLTSDVFVYWYGGTAFIINICWLLYSTCWYIHPNEPLLQVKHKQGLHTSSRHTTCNTLFHSHLFCL